MARPCKQRFISAEPTVAGFRPVETSSTEPDPVDLLVDELEALRLADVEGLSQEAGAARMNISRATFGRILERAHRTVAEAIVDGRPLRIRGGDVVATRHRQMHCGRCRRDWDVPRSVAPSFRCPRCRHDRKEASDARDR